MAMPSRSTLALAAAVVCGSGMVYAASYLDVPAEQPYDVRFVPSAGTLRWLSFGHPTLVGNLYWLRAVQYIGDPGADARGWEKLLPIIDLVTDLDPRHDYAYQIGGTILSAVNRVPEADQILEKGIRNVPDYWILHFLRAFDAFYYEGDYPVAARFMEQAASLPGAPGHLRDYVLAMYVKGKEPDAAISFLEVARRRMMDPLVRGMIDKEIKQATVERDAVPLEAAIQRFRAERDVMPASLDDLVAAGLLSAVPPDPFGGKYVIGADGRVHSSVEPFRFAPAKSPAQMQRESRGLHQELQKGAIIR